MLLLQLRPVQTFLAQEVLEVVSEQTGHEISIERVKISWLDQAYLNEILIKDWKGDTLAYSSSVKVSYGIRNLVKGNYLNIDEINAQDLDLNLIKHDSVSKLNLSIFLQALKKDTAKKSSRSIYVDQITLSDLDFKLEDKSREHDDTKLDFTNFYFDIPEFSIGELLLKDTISGEIIEFSGIEQYSSFTINELKTRFYVSNQSLSVDNLVFNTPTSHISDSLEFFYTGLDDLGHFKDSVSFILHFENSRISKQDFASISGTDVLKKDITLDGIIWGTVGDFNIEDTKLGYGNSYFVGGVSCFGLPDVSKTFVLADVTDSHVLPSDLRPHIGDYADNLNQMGRIDFTGSFAGFLNDFVARGDFETDQGSVHTDINLKIPDDPNDMSYVGNLEFKDLNFGVFFQNEIVQKINLTASIKGKGIKQENAEFDLKALLYNSGLKGYEYDSIEVDGHFAENYFNGAFSVEDTNCQINGVAQIDFRDTHEVLQVDIDLNKINADALYLTTNKLSANGRIKAEITDLDIDQFTGSLAIDSGLLVLDRGRINLDSIRVSSSFKDSTRIILAALPGLKSNLEGKFRITDALKDIPAMIASYSSELQFNKDSSSYRVSGNQYKLSFKADIDSKISSYLDSLDIPVRLGGKTLIESDFRQSRNANISMYIKSDTLLIGANELYDPVIDINGSRDLNSSDVLTNFIIESSNQVIAGVPNTEELLVEGIWFDNNIDLTTHISQPLTASDVRLKSRLNLYKDSITLKMLPSKIKVLDDNWVFNPSNKVVITQNKTTFSNLEIYDSSESITVDGVYADTIPTSITISSEDLNMNKVGLFSEAEIGGYLNSNFRIFRQSINDAFKFDGSFLIKNLVYDDLLVGDIVGSSKWNPTDRSVFSQVKVERENVNAIEVEGFYFPEEQSQQLDFNVKFDKADLKMGEPFLKDKFSNIEGGASGSLSLTGSIEKPEVVGSFNIVGGGVNINYLNTHYTFTGKVDFDPSLMTLSNFHLLDRKGSDALVTGTISHSYFRDLITDINIRANNFEFLNTTILENSLYYGSAYCTGTIDVDGPLNDLNIKATIERTEPNTRLYIPISQGTNIGQEDYISFVDFSDTTSVGESEEFKISGLTLDFDINITPDAYCELIFDIKTGEIIKGRGRGNLKLRLDTDGEFSMFGSLEISEGAYNFTAPGISKEFDVVPGSNITWYGDPYNATLDLDANYIQRASFEELDNPADRDPALLANKVPISVILQLAGGMLSPDIGFDLQLENQSDATNENISALSRIVIDEQELKRQVISLLFLRRFSPRESFTLSGGGGVGNSLGEFLSSQVSYLVSQIDENLEVEVNLADVNDEALNSFQLNLAYTFLNGRLKVTRGGDFGNQNDNNDNVLNDLVGDWTVEYSLTKDGRLRAKVFSNTNQRIQVNENQQNQEIGISLRFVHSFDDMGELFIKRKEAVLVPRKEEEEIAEEEDDDSENDSTY